MTCDFGMDIIRIIDYDLCSGPRHSYFATKSKSNLKQSTTY